MTQPSRGEEAAEAIARHLQENMPEIIERLKTWVSIPSVSADPDRQIEVVRSARWLAAELRDAGMDVSILKTGEVSAVYAERKGDPDAPTVLVYSHHDVRNAKPEEWNETEPFTPVVRDGRLYGRGASDAKGQALAHVWGLRAYLATIAGSAGVNIKFLIEGEEEIGSPNLAELLDRYRSELSCDLVVFSDTIQWRADAPAPVTSMRGTLTATLEIVGPARDVHSGVASGVTVNPAITLADVLSRLHDDSGRITVPGFYDDVTALTTRRKAEFEALPYDPAVWTERTETREVIGEQGYTLKERLWARPAIEVISLLAGDPEGIERSVIPRKATASLSIRTVPGQRIPVVADQLRAFFDAEMPAEAQYTLTVDEDIAQEPYVSPDGVVIEALERALERGYGMPVLGRMGNAGGGPADLLSLRLEAPVYFIGTGLPEDHWHASDESIDLSVLLHGAASIAHLWRELEAGARP
ncbi:M20/M25/M40 family metallo-hydrolase [Microbacterium sp.]|uniref:M20/M25/M40 family metallo-hydrolase n=1 Tax=Microbacterium sp. TaxID=51671 RepID=UPI002811B3EF|nr:M20/M25/M40 family metallo-hydrolase [Microbacterium sp.]